VPDYRLSSLFISTRYGVWSLRLEKFITSLLHRAILAWTDPFQPTWSHLIAKVTFETVRVAFVIVSKAVTSNTSFGWAENGYEVSPRPLIKNCFCDGNAAYGHSRSVEYIDIGIVEIHLYLNKIGLFRYNYLNGELLAAFLVATLPLGRIRYAITTLLLS
jgi:hypothetical protein